MRQPPAEVVKTAGAGPSLRDPDPHAGERLLRSYAKKLREDHQSVDCPWSPKAPRIPQRTFQAPNVICLTARATAPIPGQSAESEDEKGPGDGESIAGAGKSTQKGASRKSLLNLARFLSSLDWKRGGQCLHVTFTYWKRWPTKGLPQGAMKEALMDEKDDIARALKRWGRGIWRLEFQSRCNLAYVLCWVLCAKAGIHWPLDVVIQWVEHWHCLLWIGDKSEEEIELRLRAWWARHSGNGHERAVAVTSGDAVRGSWYLAMHASKSDQTPKFAVGKWWGYIDEERVKELQDVNCTDEALAFRELVWLARMYRRATGNRVRGFRPEGMVTRYQYPQGFTWFLPLAKQNQLVLWVREKVKEESQTRNDRAFLGIF